VRFIRRFKIPQSAIPEQSGIHFAIKKPAKAGFLIEANSNNQFSFELLRIQVANSASVISPAATFNITITLSESEA
jgi:hypothetical protein